MQQGDPWERCQFRRWCCREVGGGNFVPKKHSPRSFDHLVGTGEPLRINFEAKRLGGPVLRHEIENRQSESPVETYDTLLVVRTVLGLNFEDVALDVTLILREPTSGPLRSMRVSTRKVETRMFRFAPIVHRRPHQRQQFSSCYWESLRSRAYR